MVNAALRGGADVSVTVRLDKRVKATIATIAEDAWIPIEYTDAVYDETTSQWVSRAEVAEIALTAFTSKPNAAQVPGRLIVRRIPDLNQDKNNEQETLFDTWRFHAFFTTTSAETADTVAADKTHRGHAIIEQVHADLKNSALAHLRSVHRERSLAGPGHDDVQPDPRNSHDHRPGAGESHHGDHPSQTHHGPRTDRLIGEASNSAPADRMALGNSLDRTLHPGLRTTTSGDLTTQPNGTTRQQRGTP